jgi:SAM-dependent methyltransferase
MPVPTTYSFPRYLSAKKTVDDRALHRPTWDYLAHRLRERSATTSLHVLEAGAGIGTMIERAVAWDLFHQKDVVYTALDAMPENIVSAQDRLPRQLEESGYGTVENAEKLVFARNNSHLAVHLKQADLFDFIAREHDQAWDVLIAHAFMDLVDVPAALPQIFSLLKPGGLFYFTINFDGLTILEPAIDPDLDSHIEALYHRTMDERITAGQPSGDSRTGRHMFAHLRQAGAEILASGSSDWVVFAGLDGYPADEAYFLHFIVHTMHGALSGHPELDQVEFERWIAQRHAQIERGELVYIAHQLDILGSVTG